MKPWFRKVSGGSTKSGEQSQEILRWWNFKISVVWNRYKRAGAVGWMVVPTAEFENRRRKMILGRHMLNLALEILELKSVLNTHWDTFSTGVSMSLGLREYVFTGDSNWGTLGLNVVEKARVWRKTSQWEKKVEFIWKTSFNFEKWKEKESYTLTATTIKNHQVQVVWGEPGMWEMRGGNSLGNKALSTLSKQRRPIT